MGSDIMKGAPEEWGNPKNKHIVSHKVKTCSVKKTPERGHGIQIGAIKVCAKYTQGRGLNLEYITPPK